MNILLESIKPFINEINRLEREYGFDRPDNQYQCLMIPLYDCKELQRIYNENSIHE